MKMTTLKKKILCIIIAMVVVAGILNAPTMMNINATEKEVEFAIDFKNVDIQNSLHFKVSDISKFTAKYYKGIIKLDGKEIEVPFEKTADELIVWSTLYNIIDGEGKAPTSKIEISKDTILEEIYPGNPDLPSDVNSWATPTENGQKLKITNDLEVEGIGGVWNKVTGEQTHTNIGIISHRVGDGNSWYLKLDDVNKLTAKFYHGMVKVDGKDVKIVFEKTEDSFVIWNNYFDIIANQGIEAPASKFEIPKDTILYEIDPFSTGWGTPVEGGQTLKFVKEFSYQKKNNSWISSDDIAKDPVYLAIDYENVEGDGSWLFKSNDVSKLEKKFYKGKIKIDGKESEIVIEKTDSGFVIWPNYFDMIQTDGKMPSNKLEIPVGTVLYEIDPYTTGWKEPVANGEQIITTNELTVNKENVGWTTGKGVEPIVANLGKGVGIYNKGTENEVFSILIDGPENLKTTQVTVRGTFNVDGKDCEGVIFIPGNGEIFFYTMNGKKTIKLSKNTNFVSSDKKTVIRLDKDYEIDLVKQIYYEVGKKPAEKKPLNVGISYNRLVGQSFMFSWTMSDEKSPEAAWYKAEAIIDGVTKNIIMEYTLQDSSFFIYPNCFNEIPVEHDEGYPVKSFKMKKGTKLTPVVLGTWATDVLAQPYILDNDIDVSKNGTIWMNTEYIEKIEHIKPLEVKIQFKYIMNSAAVFEVVTPDGKNIDATYGDWTQARGNILRGVQNDKTKKYSYTSEYAAYSISGNTFYIDGLRLNELEGLQIDKNTMLYPDSVCKSDTPIKILNQVRIVRDENDEWVVDTKFSTLLSEADLPNDLSDESQSDDSSDGSSDDATVNVVNNKYVGIGAVAENEENKKNDYVDGNIVFAEDRANTSDSEKNWGYSVIKNDDNNMVLWIIIISAAVVILAAGCGVTIAFKKRKNKK